MKKLPTFESDAEAERFVETADLSEYDLSHLKAAQINMRVPKPLPDAVKERTRRRGIPYTRFLRELMERQLTRPEKPAGEIALFEPAILALLCARK